MIRKINSIAILAILFLSIFGKNLYGQGAYRNYEELSTSIKQLNTKYPKITKLSSIAKTVGKKDVWVLEVGRGDVDNHPGIVIVGGVDGRYISGPELTLRFAEKLLKSSSNDSINRLIDSVTFYIIPNISPDATEQYFASLRYNRDNNARATDDDRDGLVDEDGLDDVNGDGHVTYMRRKNPNGRYKIDPENPKWLIAADPDEAGEYEFLGTEGFDNDNDGRVNEDRIGGYYDPNRDWGWDWQPDYIQGGALKYPFSVPENRAVAEFVMAHQNIAGAQSYHNSGGMILRGPGSKYDVSTFHDSDKTVYDAIGKLGAKIIPGYEYMILYKDLYPAFGGELSWFHGGRGIFTFTNELFTGKYFFNKDYENFQERMNDAFEFDKYLLFEDAYVEWTPFDHPLFGEIEIGGFKRNFSRADPGFLLESDVHRNMAFTIFHAYQMPKLVVQKVEEKDLGKGLKEITALIANQRMIPTHSGNDIQNKINRPDFISIEGIDVLAGMVVIDDDMNLTKEQSYNPDQIEISNIPGMGVVRVRWIASGNDDYTIKVDSEKGGKVEWTSGS